MTADDDANVIELQLRRPSAPMLSYVEIRLLDADFGIEVSLFTEDGDLVGVLTYCLTGKSPAGFNLDALNRAWSAWRGRSTVAS